MKTRSIPVVPWVAAFSMMLMAWAVASAAPDKSPKIAPSQAQAAPKVWIVGVVGEPRLIAADGTEGVATVDAAVGIGDALETGENDRVALAATVSAEPDAAVADVLVLGPRSRMKLALATAGEGGEPPVEPLVIDVERGVFKGVIRAPSGVPSFAIRTGDRTTHLLGAAMVGTYEPEKDDAVYVALSRSIVVDSGKRRLRVRAGLARAIEEGQIRAAQRIIREQREFLIDLTSVPGVDLTQPDVASEEGSRQVAANTSAPEPWEYDAARDQYYDPNHGHWHDGRPPADAGAGAKKGPGLGLSPGAPTKPREGELAKEPPATAPEAAPQLAPADARYVRFKTTMGDFVLELDPEHAPVTVRNFLSYVNKGFYDGTIIHRVVRGGIYVIQGGGLTPDMQRKPTDPPIKNEWKNGLKNERGTISMARLRGNADSATSQFFISTRNNPSLDRPQPSDGAAYAVFGKVVQGMDVVDAIQAVATGARGQRRDVPVDTIFVEKTEVVAKPQAQP